MTPMEVSPDGYHARLKCDRSNIFAPTSFLSKSVLWELNESSLWKWRHHPKKHKPTAAMQWGSLVDTLTLTPDLFAATYVILPHDAPERPTPAMLAAAKPSASSVERQAWWKEFDKHLNGRTIISHADLKQAKLATVMLINSCKASARIYAESKSQVIVASNVNGVNMKGLVDLAPESGDYLADLKTAADFSLAGFSRTVARFGYHMQAGIYLELWNAMFPHDKRERFKIIWQDSEPPYEVAVTELARNDIEAGWSYAVTLIDRLAEATKSGHWPMAFEGHEPIITRPVWAAIQEEETANPLEVTQ